MNSNDCTNPKCQEKDKELEKFRAEKAERARQEQELLEATRQLKRDVIEDATLSALMRSALERR
jgi:hypothetical protein